MGHIDCYTKEGVLYGLAEGRKEICLEQNKDGTIRHCEVMKEIIEEAIKDHCLFRQNEVIDFTSKCVWEALNPDTKMCVPNAMFIKIEELLKEYIEKELAE